MSTIEYPAEMYLHVSLADPDELGQIGLSEIEYPMEQVSLGRIWAKPGHHFSPGQRIQVDRYLAVVDRIGKAQNGKLTWEQALVGMVIAMDRQIGDLTKIAADLMEPRHF